MLSYAKMRKPTALIDKNVLESLSHLPAHERDPILNALLNNYQVLIPAVLVEEVWTNYLNPRETTDPNVVKVMRDMVLALRDCWLVDEWELMFEELVKHKKTLPRFVMMPAEKVDEMAGLHPNTPLIQEWLTNREAIKRLISEERINRQKQIEPSGNFVLVKSERSFLRQAIKPWFDFLKDRKKGADYLHRFAGERMTKRNRGYGKRIKRAIRTFVNDPFRFRVTLNCVLSDLFYDYAPVYRVIDGTQHGRAFIRRGKSSQKNNYDDQRYVACALLCDRIVTRDHDMAKMMECFKECRLWTGEVIYLPQPGPIQDLVPVLI